MPARGFPLAPPGAGKGSDSTTAIMYRVSQETGSVCVHQPHSRGGNGGASLMSAPLHRSAVASSFRALFALAATLLLAVPCARAVIVRGTVTDPLGAVVPGA